MEKYFDSLPLIGIGLVVVLAPISLLMLRTVARKFFAQWLSEYPGITPRSEAQSRHPGYISVAGSQGNVHRAVMDDDHLHLVPSWPGRVFFGMTPRSIPWSDITVAAVANGQATATFGAHAMTCPEWMVERASRIGPGSCASD